MVLEAQDNNFIINIVMDSIRVLILIAKFEEKKSFKLNLDRIMLYDYYMKFPNTMIESKNFKVSIKYNFYEYYSFYHWKPDYNNYTKILKHLMSKGLIEREFKNREFYYCSTELGFEFIKQLNSGYKQVLDSVAEFIKDSVSKKKDNEVEQEILCRTNIINRFKGERDGEKI